MAPSPIRVPSAKEAGIVTLVGGLLFLLVSRNYPVPSELNTVMTLVTGVGAGLVIAAPGEVILRRR